MPNWVKHAAWMLILLLLLARWRKVAEFVSGIGASLKALLYRSSYSSPEDSFLPFLMFGILVVMLTALWAIWCRSKCEKKP